MPLDNPCIFIDGSVWLDKPVGRLHRWKVRRVLTKYQYSADIRYRLLHVGVNDRSHIGSLLQKIMRAFPVTLITDDALHAELLRAVSAEISWEPPRIELIDTVDTLRTRMREEQCGVCYSELFTKEAPLGIVGVVRYHTIDAFIDFVGSEVVQ